LKIEKQYLDNQQIKIIAEFDQTTFDQYKQRSARKLSKDHKIPGFRPGKAPYRIVSSMFGEDHIEQHAIEMMLDKEYPKVIDEAEINPSGPGSLDEIIQVSPPILSFIIPLSPEVELCDYKAIRKPYELPSVNEAEVDEYLKNLQRNYPSAEPVDRPVQEGDLVAIKLVGVNPIESEQQLSPIFNTSTQIIIGDSDFGPDKWPFEGFSINLIGMNETEVKTIEHKFPDDDDNNRISGKTIEFTITVDGVKEIKIPNLDDEFAKSLEEFESFQELHDSVKTNLEKQKQQEYDQKYIGQLIDEIVSNSTIKYPPNVLDNQIEQVLHSLEDDLTKENLDLPAYLKTRNLEREVFIENEVKPAAIKRLEQSLVLEKIGIEENIKVEKTELEPIVTQSLQQFQKTPGFEKYSSRTAMNRVADAVAFDAYHRLFSQHIMERLKDIASGKLDNEDEPIPPDDIDSVPDLAEQEKVSDPIPSPSERDG